jgi:hypothetical protein
MFKNIRVMIFSCCFLALLICRSSALEDLLSVNSENKPQENPSHIDIQKPDCTKEAKVCPDGEVVGRNPNNNCEFDPCPSTQACTAEAKLCPDGSGVGRNPKNNCEFDPCPK